MRTLDDLDVAHCRVLVRVDFNVPLDDDGRISDDTRIRAALPTLQRLREQDARLILAAHLGRPKDREPELSLRPVAERLEELLDVPVTLADDVVGPGVRAAADGLRDGEVLMLENLRYEAGETDNDPDLVAELAALADRYVNDAFGAAHRAHASTEGVARALPAEARAAGLLLQSEVKALESILRDPAQPLVAVLGGAKVTDKLGVITAFRSVAETILIGGAMCFPFLRAQGHEVGDSLCEDEDVEAARTLLADDEGAELVLPEDLVTGDNFSADAEVRPVDGVDVPEGWMGLDVGERTTRRYGELIAAAGTVFWNGPMGAFELEPFAAGTRAVAEAVAAAPGTTVVGGGDSAAALAAFGLEDQVTHLSTGGGATLEFIEGEPMEPLEALR